MRTRSRMISLSRQALSYMEPLPWSKIFELLGIRYVSSPVNDTEDNIQSLIRGLLFLQNLIRTGHPPGALLIDKSDNGRMRYHEGFLVRVHITKIAIFGKTFVN